MRGDRERPPTPHETLGSARNLLLTPLFVFAVDTLLFNVVWALHAASPNGNLQLAPGETSASATADL